MFLLKDAECIHLQLITARTNQTKCTKLKLPLNGQVSELVGALSPINHRGLHQGWTQTFTLSPSYSFYKSSYHKSRFLSLFVFCGHSTREPASGSVTYFILQANTGQKAQSNQKKTKKKKTWEALRPLDLRDLGYSIWVFLLTHIKNGSLCNN